MMNRIIAVFIDVMIAGGVGAVISIILEIIPLNSSVFGDLSFYTSLIFVILKDNILISGSLGKKLLGLEMYEKNKNWKARFKNAGRNIFMLVWPIEFIFAVLHPKRKRFGDLLFGTMVISKGSRNHIEEDGSLLDDLRP